MGRIHNKTEVHEKGRNIVNDVEKIEVFLSACEGMLSLVSCDLHERLTGSELDLGAYSR